MLARDVLAKVRFYEKSKVWGWIATTADAIEKELGESPWKKEWEEICAKCAWPLKEAMSHGTQAEPFDAWAVLVDLGGDYGGGRELWEFMPRMMHRTTAADHLAYALLCVALEAEIKERSRNANQRIQGSEEDAESGQGAAGHQGEAP